MDTLRRFFDDRLEFGEGYQLPVGKLQSAFESWCDEEGIDKRFRPDTRKRADRLRDHGCAEDRDREGVRGRFWWGVRLALNADEDADEGGSASPASPASPYPGQSNTPKARENDWEMTSQATQATQGAAKCGWTAPEFALIDTAADLEDALPRLLEAGAVGLDTVIRADRCLSEDRRRHDRVFAS
jgi:hypothetical protein